MVAVEEVVGWGTRVPHALAEVAGVVAAAAQGLGAAETGPGGAAGPSAGLEGAGTHAPWAEGSPLPGDCRRAGPTARGCWSPPCCGLVSLWREKCR